MAVADVTSANVVGYLNRDGRKSRNFYTPCFDKVGGGDITIQDVQLNDDVETFEADLQILDANRKFIGEMYQWVNAAETGPDDFDLPVAKGMGAWINESFELPDIDSLQFGQVVQVTLPAATDGFKSSGQVSDDDAVIVARKSRNFVGNPYPVAMSIQNIQLDDSIETFEADLQILDANRKYIGEMYQWVCAAETGPDDFDLPVPEGMGAWINESFELPDIDPLQAGEGVQVTLPTAGSITVVAPIEL